jgi:hypothetical protein
MSRSGGLHMLLASAVLCRRSIGVHTGHAPCALCILQSATRHRFSQAELDKGHRQNELQEVERSNDGMTGYGAQNQGSPMRHRLRSSGAMEGQVRVIRV